MQTINRGKSRRIQGSIAAWVAVAKLSHNKADYFLHRTIMSIRWRKEKLGGD
jgi:hypothetical protein